MDIARDAYIYLYPLVTMDLTRRQLLSLPEDGNGACEAGRSNWLTPVRSYPSAADKEVVRPNFDTLYTDGFLDLEDEPVVLSVPDTKDRYYLLPMLDMWTDAFASPGWRTTGTGAGHFLIAPTVWKPDLQTGLDRHLGLPEGTVRIDAPTDRIWIIGRIFTKGTEDYAEVNAIQDDIVVTPLSKWGTTVTKPPRNADPSVDVKTPVKIQVDQMSGEQFFTYASRLLNTTRTHPTDQAQLALMQRIGLVRGGNFDFASVDEQTRLALSQAPEAAQKLMASETSKIARVVNGWVMNTNTMGVYGDYYLKRAIVAQLGLGANVEQDAIYPMNIGDSNGQPLDGASQYQLHFGAGELPPADAFWSVTMYDAQGYQVANELNRFAISSWTPLRNGADGSLTLYIQHQSPGADKDANWLPAPAGNFNLLMRLYAPTQEVLRGQWNPPAVIKQ